MATRPPHPHMLNRAYARLMRLTGRHGFHTLARWNARLFPAGERVSLPGGLELFVPPDPHFFGYLLGHEAHITERLLRVLSPGDVCVDVGANIGYFTLVMAGLAGREGMVYAYEPESANHEVLQRNAACARDERGAGLTVFRAAVSSADGHLTLQRGAYSTYHQVRAVHDGDAPEDRVPCVRLDSSLAALGERRAIRVIKVDVEGHEPDVLEGCRALLEAGRVEHVVTEFHPAHEAPRIERFLREWSTTAEAWIGGRWQPYVPGIASRTDLWITLRCR